jgi:hypothetical protein
LLAFYSLNISWLKLKILCSDVYIFGPFGLLVNPRPIIKLVIMEWIYPPKALVALKGQNYTFIHPKFSVEEKKDESTCKKPTTYQINGNTLLCPWKQVLAGEGKKDPGAQKIRTPITITPLLWAQMSMFDVQIFWTRK